MSHTTTSSTDPFPGVSHLPTRQGAEFPGVAAQNLHGNRGELPAYDPGPLGANAWFATANAVSAPQYATASGPGPQDDEGWFPGIPVRPATDA